MRGSVKSKESRFRIEKRQNHWCVLGRQTGLIYSSTCYAKAVGVLEHIQAQEAKTATN